MNEIEDAADDRVGIVSEAGAKRHHRRREPRHETDARQEHEAHRQERPAGFFPEGGHAVDGSSTIRNERRAAKPRSGDRRKSGPDAAQPRFSQKRRTTAVAAISPKTTRALTAMAD